MLFDINLVLDSILKEKNTHPRQRQIFPSDNFRFPSRTWLISSIRNTKLEVFSRTHKLSHQSVNDILVAHITHCTATGLWFLRWITDSCWFLWFWKKVTFLWQRHVVRVNHDGDVLTKVREIVFFVTFVIHYLCCEFLWGWEDEVDYMLNFPKISHKKELKLLLI